MKAKKGRRCRRCYQKKRIGLFPFVANGHIERRRSRVCRACSPNRPQGSKSGAATARWKRKHPMAYRAHKAVAYAIKAGRLVRPEKCERCPATERIHAHHDSYDRDKWLDVKWLCPRCHKHRHKELALPWNRAPAQPAPVAPQEERRAA